MVILYILLVLIAVILARTLMFTPKKQETKEYPPVEQDTDASIRNLAELVKCRTVSYYDASLEDDLEFEKLILKLPKLYPSVFETCTLQRFDGRGLLFRWQGRQEGDIGGHMTCRTSACQNDFFLFGCIFRHSQFLLRGFKARAV